MAWTTPRTWVTDELVTAAIMNSAVRDNFNSTMHLVARKTADQSVTSSTTLVADARSSCRSVRARSGGTSSWSWRKARRNQHWFTQPGTCPYRSPRRMAPASLAWRAPPRPPRRPAPS